MAIEKVKIKRSGFLLLCMSIATIIVVSLYFFSYRINRDPNGFIRQFPPHLTSSRGIFELKYNSYYIAGMTKHHFYLGNHTTPGFLYIFDQTLLDSTQQRISTPPGLKFTKQTTEFVVDSPFVYLTEYRNSLILAGRFPCRQLEVIDDSTSFFDINPVSPSRYIMQMDDAARNQHLLVRKYYGVNSQSDTSYMLDPSRMGIIKTDGTLNYENKLGLLIFVYHYQNLFLVMDSNLQVRYKGATIDTIHSPHVELTTINNGKSITTLVPPLMVNTQSAVNDKWIFVQSALRANNESKEHFESSSVIDVYNLKNGKYAFSFHVSNTDNSKIKYFQVSGQEMLVLLDHSLYYYHLNF